MSQYSAANSKEAFLFFLQSVSVLGLRQHENLTIVFSNFATEVAKIAQIIVSGVLHYVIFSSDIFNRHEFQ